MDTDLYEDWDPPANLWKLYLIDCEHEGIHPSVKDYYEWVKVQDTDEP